MASFSQHKSSESYFTISYSGTFANDCLITKGDALAYKPVFSSGEEARAVSESLQLGYGPYPITFFKRAVLGQVPNCRKKDIFSWFLSFSLGSLSFQALLRHGSGPW